MKFKDNRVTELIQFCILSGRRNCSDVTVVSLEVLIDDKLDMSCDDRAMV